METLNVNVPERLKKIREQRKLTQGQVAQRLSIKRGTYQAYEESRALPPLSVLLRLAVIYDVHSLDQLLGIKPIEVSAGDELFHAYQAAKPASRQIVDIALNYNC